MAKKAVVEIQCDRCPRREYIDPETTKPAGPTVITFMGVTVKFDDLCSACHKAVAAHIEGIGHKLEGRSPERTAKTKKSTPEEVNVIVPADKAVDLTTRPPVPPRVAR